MGTNQPQTIRKWLNNDLFLDTINGRLWMYEEYKGKGGAIIYRIYDIKTKDIHSSSIHNFIYLNGMKFIGNFPNSNPETLEVLYGQRKGRWNY